MLKTIFFRTYALISYGLGILSLVCFMLFANNGFVDLALWSGDSLLSVLAIDIFGPTTGLPPLAVNTALVILFGIQHTVMARPSFKAFIKPVIPTAIERSTYVLFTSIVLIILILFWQPDTDLIWQLDNPSMIFVVNAVYWLGWIISFAATQMIDGAHLMGLRQAFKPDRPAASAKNFVTPAFYKLVRHPIQTGILIAMVATPEMTVGRATLAIAMTIYILIGLYFEERDLVSEFGEQYQKYKDSTPGLFPGVFGKKPTSE